jgi:hypothetical protein
MTGDTDDADSACWGMYMPPGLHAPHAHLPPHHMLPLGVMRTGGRARSASEGGRMVRFADDNGAALFGYAAHGESSWRLRLRHAPVDCNSMLDSDNDAAGGGATPGGGGDASYGWTVRAGGRALALVGRQGRRMVQESTH